MSIDQLRSQKKVNGFVGEIFEWYDVEYQLVSTDRKGQIWVLLDLFTLRELRIH